MMGAALPSPIRPRLGQFVRLLASDRDGEVVAAARAIGRMLKGAGVDFHDLAATVETEPAERVVVQWRDRPVPTASTEPKSWPELARWIRDNDKGRLAVHERDFVRDMASRLVLNGQPSEKQAAWLRRLYAKLGGPA